MRREGRIVLAIVAGLGLTSAAWGVGHGRGHGMGGHMHAGDPADHILQRVVHPCAAKCFDDDRTCMEAAVSTATTCVTNACAADVGTAQTACKSGRTSSCQTAMGALHTCAQSCTDAAAKSSASCRTTMTSCLATCGQA